MAKTLLLIAVLSCIICFSAGGRLVIRDCTRYDESLATEVTVDSPDFPDGTETATLVKGRTYTLVMGFRSSAGYQTLTTTASAIIAGVEAPWAGINPNACANLVNATCPFAAGTLYTYSNSISVQASYPAVSLTIIWRFHTSNANEVCFELPARIQNA